MGPIGHQQEATKELLEVWRDEKGEREGKIKELGTAVGKHFGKLRELAESFAVKNEEKLEENEEKKDAETKNDAAQKDQENKEEAEKVSDNDASVSKAPESESPPKVGSEKLIADGQEATPETQPKENESK